MSAPLPDLIRLARGPRLWALAGASLLGAMLEGAGFVLLVPLVDATLGGEAGGRLSEALRWIGPLPSLGTLLAIFVAILALRAAAEFARRLLTFDIRMAVVDGLRHRAISALVAADWRYLSRQRQSDNRALLLTAIERAGLASSSLFALVTTLFNLGAVALAALVISPLFALLGVVAGALVLLLYRGLRSNAARLGEALTGRNKAVFGNLEKTLDGMRIIKSFGAEDRMAEEARAGFTAMRKVQRRYIAQSGLARLALQIAGAIALAAIVWFAVTQWNYDSAMLLPLIAIFARAVPQLAGLQEQWQDWSHAAPALHETWALIEQAEAAREVPGEISSTPHSLETGFALRGVTVRHREGAPALDNVTLEGRAGSIIALTGPSGCGKSTLADVLGGLIAPDEGEVVLDGRALRPGERREWRAKVAYVQQEPVLFHGTVRDNLLWADPGADDVRLEQALQRAHAGFVFDLPQGLDTPVGDAGRHLSGGERQRIVLARGLLRDPALLILDEATSALDTAAEREVADAVEAMRGSCTILVITHRGLLAELADRHLVMEAGRFVNLQS
ncbi:MAG: ABC transporter ATP-binding protein [Altererythrobacter sp.]